MPRHPGGRPTKINLVLRTDPITCRACEGEGTLTDDQPCTVCKGLGITGENEVTVADAIIDAIRGGNYIETAARLADVDKVTLHAWLKEGAGLAIAVNNGKRSLSSLKAQEKRLLEFSYSVQRATAEAESAGQAGILAAGRLRQQKSRTTTVTKMVNGVRVVETTTTTEDVPADWRALAWHQERRFFGQGWGPKEQVELTGADGGPVELDLTVRAAELTERVRRVKEGGIAAIEAGVTEQHPNDEGVDDAGDGDAGDS